MEILQDTKYLPKPPSVTFTADPPGDIFVWTIDGNTYPAVGQPQSYIYSTGAEIDFEAEVYIEAPVQIVSYEWDFGDGELGYGQFVRHKFNATAPGIRVTLRVEDNFGRIATAGKNIILQQGEDVILQRNIIVEES